jgi:dihydrofolate synthase/folylpolyglutamate synthase
MEIVGREPLVVLDGAKNLEGAAAAAAAVAEEFGPSRSVILVVGMLGGAGKAPARMLAALGAGSPGVRLVIACPAPSPRAVPAAQVAAAAGQLGVKALEAPGVAEALEMAAAEASDADLILVTGSLYVVGAARSILAAG